MSRRIYHLVPPRDWPAAGAYRPASLEREGFIHCSNRGQVARIANLFYAAEPELLVLVIDAECLGGLLRDEDIGTGERFPHVYGAIERPAIVDVQVLRRNANGEWGW